MNIVGHFEDCHVVPSLASTIPLSLLCCGIDGIVAHEVLEVVGYSNERDVGAVTLVLDVGGVFLKAEDEAAVEVWVRGEGREVGKEGGADGGVGAL